MLTMTVRVNPEIHPCLVEVLWYLENRGDFIDPDMFEIDAKKVKELQQLFHAEYELENFEPKQPPEEVELTFEELWTLDYYLLAAEEYSARSTERELLKVEEDEWKLVREWIERAKKLFRPH
jgi:hypothetical protein